MTARRPIPLALAMFRVVGCSGQPGSHAHHLLARRIDRRPSVPVAVA